MHLGEQYETDMIRDLRDDPNEPQGRPVTRDMVLNDEYDTERALNARRLLETVERVAQWMGDLRGRRKALVLFTEGFDYDIYAPFARQASRMIRDARDAIAAAQRANVSIYAVDARGLLQVPGDAINTRGLSNDPSVRAGSILGYQRELLMAQEGLLTLAAETGGLAVINTNDVQAGLDRVVGDSSTYYLLGYATDPKPAGGGRLPADRGGGEPPRRAGAAPAGDLSSAVPKTKRSCATSGVRSWALAPRPRLPGMRRSARRCQSAMSSSG